MAFRTGKRACVGIDVAFPGMAAGQAPRYERLFRNICSPAST